MNADASPLSWPAIIGILAAAAVATGLVFGALGYLIPLPAWLPGAALAGVVGVLAPILMTRRNARIEASRRTRRP